MRYIIENERLFLREFNIEDSQKFFELNSNPNVIKHTGDSAFKNEQEARLFLENYNDYKENGYGRWVVIEKEYNEFLGWCGLKYTKHNKTTDIGFRFFEQQWNKGYATESALACIEYGFECLKLKAIIGRAMKSNIASIRVLDKIGLSFVEETILDDEEWVIFKTTYSK